MCKDGFNIPAETFLGFDNDKVPCFCFGVAPEAEENVREIVNKPLDVRNNSSFIKECIEFISDEQLSLLKN